MTFINGTDGPNYFYSKIGTGLWVIRVADYYPKTSYYCKILWGPVVSYG